MTPREAATKRYTDAGGTWPPQDGPDDAQAVARQRAVRVAAVSWLRSPVRPLAELVSGLF